MEDNHYILRIALPTRLRTIFDYLLPETISIDQVKVGLRVKVPFRQREIIGIVLAIANKSDLPISKLKEIIQLVDNEPLINEKLLSLFYFASNYYHHPLGEVIFAGLPPSLREGALAVLPNEKIYYLSEIGMTASETLTKHAVQQKTIIDLLMQHPNGLAREEIVETPGQVKALTALLAKGYVQKKSRNQVASHSRIKQTSEIKLDEYQAKAVTTITSAQGFNTFLLDGVTGSGKTEVYLQCIEFILKQNKQALILVPEIGLTPQTVVRFQSRFSVPISILHSKLSEKERSQAWVAASQGIARIVIGTRSAVLTPLPQLGIIILDEEHDVSFKQQNGFRYSAKDLAVMRGKLESIPVILGSATPCLETFYNAKRERFIHLMLPKRAGKSTPPTFYLINIKNERLKEGFSSVLIERMQHHLQQNNQVLIFINRRGFAPTLLCHQCGWVADCTRCDARLTYHAQLQKLLCHHCSTNQKLYEKCAQCGSTDLLLLGVGTQRVEQQLSDCFPDVPILRIDRDSTKLKGSMEKMLADINAGSKQILIGTQMLAKGHHFPNVTMVAILDIDNCLYSSDFRASERLGQLITQVAGRSGRAEKAGEVYMQTHNPEHPLLAQLIRQDYGAFADSLLLERQASQLPPFTHLALFRAEATDIKLPHSFLTEVRDILLSDTDLQVFGPIPALMEKKAGKFRAQLLIQTKERRILQEALPTSLKKVEALRSSYKVRWSLDIDPIELF